MSAEMAKVRGWGSCSRGSAGSAPGLASGERARVLLRFRSKLALTLRLVDRLIWVHTQGCLIHHCGAQDVPRCSRRQCTCGCQTGRHLDVAAVT